MAINQAERAYRAWPVLTATAERHETITYGELAAALGVHHRAVRYVLGVVQEHCLQEKLPPLTILIVNQGEGVPGAGFIAWDVDDLQTGMSRVFNYNWGQLENPFAYASDGSTENDLADEIVRKPSNSGDVYAKVKVRGAAQSIFRKALLKIYSSQCALCGLSFEDALEAAHLIPWTEADHHQRMSPTNGILLCATHHNMMDAGLLTISLSYVVTYSDPNEHHGPYSLADRAMSTKLHGSKARMPASKEHQPGADALAHHHKRLGWGRLA